HDVGDSALRMWSRVGLPAVSPSSTEAWQSLATLADGDTRRAFLATSRSVIDAGGQTVGARNRLAGLRSRDVLLVWGERDRMIPSSHVEAARVELPHSQVAMLSRSGTFHIWTSRTRSRRCSPSSSAGRDGRPATRWRRPPRPGRPNSAGAEVLRHPFLRD